MKKKLSISSLITEKNLNKNLLIFSDFTSKISKTKEMYKLLSKHDATPFNIGTDIPEISIFDLAKKCIKASGKKNIDVIFKKSNDANYLKDNPNRRCPDISKAKSLLGYYPMISLNEGLSRTFDYYSR